MKAAPMTISVSDRLPDADFLVIGDKGPQPVSVQQIFEGRKVVLFGLPGAFTSTCNRLHVPGFIRAAPDFAAKGVDEIVCVSVNDPFVMQAWGASTGADAAGLRMLADPASEFTSAIGLTFDAPPAGFYGRSQRYSMLVEDRTVRVLNLEEARGVCEISSAETLLDQI
jgi:glutaredoxin/glutathione-dependent peroxiredoxin